jgi:hypothetical protein
MQRRQVQRIEQQPRSLHQGREAGRAERRRHRPQLVEHARARRRVAHRRQPHRLRLELR